MESLTKNFMSTSTSTSTIRMTENIPPNIAQMLTMKRKVPIVFVVFRVGTN